MGCVPVTGEGDRLVRCLAGLKEAELTFGVSQLGVRLAARRQAQRWPAAARLMGLSRGGCVLERPVGLDPNGPWLDGGHAVATRWRIRGSRAPGWGTARLTARDER